jgi:hypothetical protein
MLLAVDFYEDFINEESIAVSLVLSLQSSSVYSTELDTPEPNGLPADSDSALSE